MGWRVLCIFLLTSGRLFDFGLSFVRMSFNPNVAWKNDVKLLVILLYQPYTTCYSPSYASNNSNIGVL